MIKRIILILCFLPMLVQVSTAQVILDVVVVGNSDDTRNSTTRDLEEAVIDAKRLALEKAGIKYDAWMSEENFEFRKSWIESKSEQVIIPDFVITELGYGENGSFQVRLVCQVRIGEDDLGDEAGDNLFRQARRLMRTRLQRDKALKILTEVVEKHGNCSAADDAVFYLIINAIDKQEAQTQLEYLKLYYPDSKYIKLSEEQLKNWNDLSQKAILQAMTFVTIPAGKFYMGASDIEKGFDPSEAPMHEVQVKEFEMMTTEVSQELWEAVVGHNPAHFVAPFNPVERVSWNEVQSFISKLNKLDKEHSYRLPAEAEWEYACRAGTRTRFFSGQNEAKLFFEAWYSTNSGNKTHEIGRKRSNAFGLFDMHGNVWEWVEDDWHENYENAPVDGKAWVEKPRNLKRVYRGGAWGNKAEECRSASRKHHSPEFRFYNIGFRLVRE